MSSAVDSIFGGSDDSAQKAQQRANTSAQEFIAGRAAEARGEILPMSNAALRNLFLGNQSAIDALGGSVRGQYSSLREGSRAAQNSQIAGLQQIQAALMGLPSGYLSLRQDPAGPNLDFLNTRMPSFQTGGPGIFSGATHNARVTGEG